MVVLGLSAAMRALVLGERVPVAGQRVRRTKVPLPGGQPSAGPPLRLPPLSPPQLNRGCVRRNVQMGLMDRCWKVHQIPTMDIHQSVTSFQ